MSLKINESAQEKVKSLSDLFGDNLTEAARADLEWAAQSAAQDLAAVIFSEKEPNQGDISENSTDLKHWYGNSEGIAALRFGYQTPPLSHYVGDAGGIIGNIEQIQKKLHEMNACRNFGLLNSRVKKTCTRPQNNNDDNYLVTLTTSDNPYVKGLIAGYAHFVETQFDRESFLEHQKNITKLNDITAVKKFKVTVQETGGAEFSRTIPHQLRRDREGILTRTKNLHTSHKVK